MHESQDLSSNRMSDDRPHMMRRHDSPDTFAQATAPSSSAANANVSDHGSKSTANMALFLSGAAFGGVVVLAILMHVYWAESRLANLHYADMKAAMLAYGINPNPHLPKESP